MARTLASQISRLNELAQLKDGWLDGEGSKISPEALTAAHQLTPQLHGVSNRQFNIFPTEAGGLSFEHMTLKDRIHIEIEIIPDGTCTLYVGDHQADTGRFIEGILIQDAIRFARDPFSPDAIQEPLFHTSSDPAGVTVVNVSSGERARGEFTRDPSLKSWAREMEGAEFTARAAHPTLRQALTGAAYRP